MTGKGSRKRVLFFAEPVTLAHVARPIALARGLDTERFDVTVATGAAYRSWVEGERYAFRELYSVGSSSFLGAVASGRPVFPYVALERYVDDDLRHIRDVQPDVIIGDFRVSLAVSARLESVPYIAVSNAYWSPYADPQYNIPVHPTSRLLGPSVATWIFRLVRPIVFAHHSLPMHRLRRRYDMPSLGFDLRRVFTEADLTLFADVPEIVPSHSTLRDRYLYVGPVTWSPEIEPPEVLRNDSDPRPLVYVTMGSSGNSAFLAEILKGLEHGEHRVAVATAGALPPSGLPPGIVFADFLPGDWICARASLVICNGGSPTSQQALMHGVPVLGIPANLDQLLNMYYLERFGAALSIRPERLTASVVRDACVRILRQPSYRARAQAAAEIFRRYDSKRAFAEVVTEATSRSGGGDAPSSGLASGEHDAEPNPARSSR
jgi:UDP:flavonoid glycosyltransferase YjiC (YdhE family)